MMAGVPVWVRRNLVGLVGLASWSWSTWPQRCCKSLRGGHVGDRRSMASAARFDYPMLVGPGSYDRVQVHEGRSVRDDCRPLRSLGRCRCCFETVDPNLTQTRIGDATSFWTLGAVS